MNPTERQAFRIEVLKTICENTSYSTNKTTELNNMPLLLEKSNFDELNDAALHLYDLNYITGNEIHYQGQRVLKNIKPSSHGINFIESLLIEPLKTENNSDFSPNAINLFIGTVQNSNVVTGSSNVTINSHISADSELLSNTIKELSKAHTEEIDKLLNLLKDSLESKKEDKGYLNGILSAISSINSSIIGNLITPAVKIWLGIA